MQKLPTKRIRYSIALSTNDKDCNIFEMHSAMKNKYNTTSFILRFEQLPPHTHTNGQLSVLSFLFEYLHFMTKYKCSSIKNASQNIIQQNPSTPFAHISEIRVSECKSGDAYKCRSGGENERKKPSFWSIIFLLRKILDCSDNLYFVRNLILLEMF